ncbi:hypothetical protein COB18_03145 [Candidatus Kaiserbacteria bacterium]|nr:MAG: hypothetical protein COB18_03145 [Candidatus Kaiserbacteria bacterium]
MSYENPKKNEKTRIELFQQPDLYTYIDESHPMIQAAKEAALKHSLTPTFPIGIVIEKNGEIISSTGNGNGYHEKNLETLEHKGGCKRRYISQQLEDAGKPKLVSGEKFNLCPGCDPAAHAEARAITESTDPEKLDGATIYLYGHWWCCEDCWDKLKKNGISDVRLIEKFKDKSELHQWRDLFIEESKK